MTLSGVGVCDVHRKHEPSISSHIPTEITLVKCRLDLKVSQDSKEYWTKKKLMSFVFLISHVSEIHK